MYVTPGGGASGAFVVKMRHPDVRRSRLRAAAKTAVMDCKLLEWCWSSQEDGAVAWRGYGMPHYRSKPAGAHKCSAGRTGERYERESTLYTVVMRKLKKSVNLPTQPHPGFYEPVRVRQSLRSRCAMGFRWNLVAAFTVVGSRGRHRVTETGGGSTTGDRATVSVLVTPSRE